jgi:asparagine synthase (glutamine-hydrolysing)
MPGLAGFTQEFPESYQRQAVALDMRNLLSHGPHCHSDEVFCDERVCGTRSHIGVLQKEPQPLTMRHMHVWLDGEIYNRCELEQSLGIAATTTDLEFLARIFDAGQEPAILDRINGSYAAVIYDSLRRKLHLLSDRHGLRDLYWLREQNDIAWGSEVKVFCALPGFRPRIDIISLQQFLNIGYLLEDHTWFEQVKLLGPGSHVTWDLERHTVTERRYWWWDRIQPLQVHCTEEEIAEELGRRFRTAVERRCHAHESIGITLSGGLDSRAILAALPDTTHLVSTVTFGRHGCLDERIARRVARSKGVGHEFLEISDDNWLGPRLHGVWLTDGQLNLMDMHGIEFLGTIRGWYDINLSGFLGDAVLGGSYMLKPEHAADAFGQNSVAEMMHCDPALLESVDQYARLAKNDFYMVQNRGRRFIAAGLKQSLATFEQRTPFFDNELIDFAYSLPDALRYRSHIYNRMLLQTFPGLYHHIPWQATGVPIDWPDWGVGVAKKLRHYHKKAIWNARRLGLLIQDPESYTDYPRWLRSEPARSFIQQILCGSKALYAEYLPQKPVRALWEAHLSGKDHSTMICRYATFELWLQQVYMGRYRGGAASMEQLTRSQLMTDFPIYEPELRFRGLHH